MVSLFENLGAVLGCLQFPYYNIKSALLQDNYTLISVI